MEDAVHAAQWSSTLKMYVSPVFGSLPAQAIDTALVMRVIEPLWTTKPETAGRLRGRIEWILDWARVRGYRTGENPAAVEGPSRSSSSCAEQGPQGRASRRLALRRDRQLHDRLAPGRRRRRPCARVDDPDRDPHIGDAQRDMVRDRSRRQEVDRPRREDERPGKSIASRCPMRR